MNKIKYKVENIINNHDNLNITADNEDVTFNIFNDNIENMDIIINQKSNSRVVINYSGLSNKDATINIISNICGNNNFCKFNVRVISNANVTFNATIKANENTIENEFIEDLKGINENGSINFMPILLVDTNEVSASHFATIGSLDENKLFYLQSKGISLETARNILKNNFIYGLFDKNFKEKIEKGDKNE